MALARVTGRSVVGASGSERRAGCEIAAAANAFPVRGSRTANTSPGTSGIQKANTRWAMTPTRAISRGTPTAVRANVVAASIPPVATNGIGTDCAR